MKGREEGDREMSEKERHEGGKTPSISHILPYNNTPTVLSIETERNLSGLVFKN